MHDPLRFCIEISASEQHLKNVVPEFSKATEKKMNKNVDITHVHSQTNIS